MSNGLINRQYVGARYVPKIMGEWNKALQYEALSVVTYMGNSFTSKVPVPANVNITNEDYWVNTGNYNAQIENYRIETKNITNKFNANFILVEDYGAKGDGITDDTEAFKQALSVCNNSKQLYLRTGASYIISDTLNVTNTSIIGNHSTLICNNEIDNLIVFTNDFTDPDKRYEYANNIIKDIKILCNGKCNTAIKSYSNAVNYIQYVVIDSPKQYGILCDNSALDCYNILFTNNMQINNSTAIKCYADSYYKNLHIIDYHTAIETDNTNFFIGCHMWIRPPHINSAIFNGSVAFKIHGAQHITDCYIDTYNYGISIETAGTNWCFCNNLHYLMPNLTFTNECYLIYDTIGYATQNFNFVNCDFYCTDANEKLNFCNSSFIGYVSFSTKSTNLIGFSYYSSVPLSFISGITNNSIHRKNGTNYDMLINIIIPHSVWTATNTAEQKIGNIDTYYITDYTQSNNIFHVDFICSINKWLRGNNIHGFIDNKGNIYIKSDVPSSDETDNYTLTLSLS